MNRNPFNLHRHNFPAQLPGTLLGTPFFVTATRPTMSEPAQDTAKESALIAPLSSIRVPESIAEVNRFAFALRDRNKKEEDRDVEILENDTPVRGELSEVIREITIAKKYRELDRERKYLDIVYCCTLTIIFALLLTLHIWVSYLL